MATDDQTAEPQEAALTPRWLSVELAATYSSLSARSIRRLIASGRLVPRRPVRGRIVLDRLEIDSLIAGSVATLRRGRGQRASRKHRTSSPVVTGRKSGRE